MNVLREHASLKQVFTIALVGMLVPTATAMGAPAFVPASGSPFAAAGDSPQSLVAEDFNRDGKMDVAVALRESSRVSVLLGDGHGGLSPVSGSPFPILGFGPTEIVAADFDTDGKADVATANCGAVPQSSCGERRGDISVLLGDGTGVLRLSGSAHATGGRSPFTVATGDLNRDGKPDVVTGDAGRPSDAGSKVVSVLLGDGLGGLSLTTDSPYTTGMNPRVGVGDFNADGNADVIAANFHPDNNVTLLLGDGLGGLSLAPASPFPTLARSATDVTVGDLNGDGRADAATANFNTDNVSVLLGDGHGKLSSAPGSPFPGGQSPIDLAAADLDGDAVTDFAVAHLFPADAAVLLADGQGGYAPAPGSPVTTGGSTTFSVAAADFNGDRKPDLAFANFASDSVSVLLNNLIWRSDFKNGAQYCKALRASTGDEAFGKRFGTNSNSANAFGQCVSSSK